MLKSEKELKMELMRTRESFDLGPSADLEAELKQVRSERDTLKNEVARYTMGVDPSSAKNRELELDL